MSIRSRPLPTAAAAPLLAFVLAACGSPSNDSPESDGRPSPPPQRQQQQQQQQPTRNVDGGDVRGDDGPAPNLPEGWLASMQEYADCLNQNGAQGIKVDTARGSLELSSVLPPEAVSTCMKYNPVSKQGGAKEKRP
ncbi:hypothetical protein [Streptomyces sp. NPDC003952]